jgi:hypothetical protein
MLQLFRCKKLLLTLVIFYQSGLCLAQDMPVLPSNQLVLPDTDQRMSFIWKGDSMGGVWNPHAALLIPVKLPHCPRPFYMQFDLGSPYSMFYKNKLADISMKYPRSVQLNDSIGTLTSFSFLIGKTKILAHQIPLKEYAGNPVQWNKKNIEIIGTIGADLIENKIVLIDYPGKTILLSNDTKHTASVALSDFIFARRAVLLPALLKGKKLMLYFDTGSSAFELLTSKETAVALAAPGAIATQYPVRSWNKTLIANTLATNDSISIAAQQIPLVATTYMENVSETMISQMLKMGIGGMTGNKLFLNYILVLDTKNKKFGLRKPTK